MALLYPYKCAAGHTFDTARADGQQSDGCRCPQCGEPARRLYELRGIGRSARPTGSRP